MSDDVFQNQYKMLYLSPRGTGHVGSQSLQNSQWDFKCLSTRYSKYLVKKKTYCYFNMHYTVIDYSGIGYDVISTRLSQALFNCRLSGQTAIENYRDRR